jgi:uncharacterized protein (TIGR02145 family)
METITFEGLEYGIVESKTGRLWLDRNLGATQVATSHDDKKAYGKYYKFNNVICPEGWRLPTEEEWKEETNSWISESMTGALSSELKLPCAGIKTYNNNLNERRYSGHYWSSTEFGSSNSLNLYFNSGFAGTDFTNHSYGLSVRCIKDE